MRYSLLLPPIYRNYLIFIYLLLEIRPVLIFDNYNAGLNKVYPERVPPINR